MVIKIFLWINISLFILHEMDAVNKLEWRMIPLMKKINENYGHVIFTSLHFILFIIIFYLMEYHLKYFFPAISVLFILHQLVHIIFRKNMENRMNNLFSQVLIFLMFLNSLLGLVYYYVK